LAYPHGFHEGAPMGVQITSHAWREDLLLDVGDALQRLTGPVLPISPQ
jgi:Asp-tRNA(Asn)/Glu-tRNA(Gln) amidotransferase A subunit family amidase